MTDLELINFLWKLLCDLVTDGDDPSQEDYDVLGKELFKRGITDKEDNVFWGSY